MPDDPYQRYQAAYRAQQAHTASCTSCTDAARCPDGARLWASFTRLQDAYLTRLNQRRRR
ncbi:hypothetical protein ABT133_29370 [Streptomyces sp. NPDC001835]|uniref:hypothetical protein n=1 Tax=Streptomyces sp. NPDC001835 TaxID=3154528 RepID=UPI0033348A05